VIISLSISNKKFLYFVCLWTIERRRMKKIQGIKHRHLLTVPSMHQHGKSKYIIYLVARATSRDVKNAII
jgi:hypothetical protein